MLRLIHKLKVVMIKLPTNRENHQKLVRRSQEKTLSRIKWFKINWALKNIIIFNMNVSVEIRRNEVSPSLKLIINAMSNNNTKSMLSVAGREFLSMTRQNFGKSGNYRTDSWPSLSRNYARRIHTSTAT